MELFLTICSIIISLFALFSSIHANNKSTRMTLYNSIEKSIEKFSKIIANLTEERYKDVYNGSKILKSGIYEFKKNISIIKFKKFKLYDFAKQKLMYIEDLYLETISDKSIKQENYKKIEKEFKVLIKKMENFISYGIYI